MRSLAAFARDLSRPLSGVLFDLDDTVLDHGELGLAAYQALWRLKATDLRLVGVTGRPAMWAELLCQQWPVDAMVAENGHVAYMREGKRPCLIDWVSAEERSARQRQLQAICEQTQDAFPNLVRADDSRQRLTDVTYDIGEFRTVPQDEVAAAAKRAQELGARTTASSVHLHLSLDADDKASGSLRLLNRIWGEDQTSARSRYAYIGDSGNDVACFAAFHHSFGVANVTRGLTRMPRFVASESRGAGFAQVVDAILSSHRAS